ncbi:phosphoribosylglycinamide formyltransferase [Algivirga pacifica]|uniref:Phosphoribosylglycinamide formyltransferase n=1 Tax=Algivirga pacifica TaxID=1162670 RepID=A0ABP9DMC8_9BACT
MKTTNIAILASGTGSNALKIMEHFEGREDINFIVISNRKHAAVLDKAKAKNVPAYHFSRTAFNETNEVLDCLQEFQADFIILAGFLLLVPEAILETYENKVINIHPALLPKFGGKGMFGMNVHQAVVEAKEKVSGITIHYCNKEYDEGQVILQATCNLDVEDTPEVVAKKVLTLEHFYFPRVIEQLVEATYAAG